jgi:hypothetical protein
VLEKTKAFPPVKLTPELCDSVIMIDKATICFYDELPQLLREKGHGDLAKVIETKISAYKDQDARIDLSQSLRKIAKRVDQKLLNGALLRFKNRKGKS